MNELSLGLWLRRERERRGVTLRQIADQTKVAVPLLGGLETDDLSRWPGGIYRRAFVKSYAVALGLDADEVLRRFEQEHPPEPSEPEALQTAAPPGVAAPESAAAASDRRAPRTRYADPRTRLLGTAADLTVAIVLGLGSAAAGSRLLWPVLFIALYYALGVLLTGTSPMVALLSDERDADPALRPGAGEPATLPEDARAQRPAPERRPTGRRISRAQRASKATRPRVQ